ncbi:hypothetical protein JTE90_012950, partial [Oedothorax gibbosus]
MASQRGKETPKTLLGIKNSSDYKKFNKVDSPKSCDILESWVVTLASEPELASFRDNVNALTVWLSEVRDLRLGYGMQNLMAGLFLDPILDGLKNFHRNTIFLKEEILRLTAENTKLKAENDLNTSQEERQELRLLTSENATLVSQSQELLSRVQFLEAKESALMDLKSDLDQKLSDAVAPVVKIINNKIDDLNNLTEVTFGKIREQETKVLNQYKTYLDEIKIGRRQEQELVKVIQAREDEVLRAAEKLLTTEVPEPAWLAAFLDKASSLGERVTSPPLGPPAAVPTVTSKVDVGASSGGLELVLLQDKGRSDFPGLSSGGLAAWRVCCAWCLGLRGRPWGKKPFHHRGTPTIKGPLYLILPQKYCHKIKYETTRTLGRRFSTHHVPRCILQRGEETTRVEKDDKRVELATRTAFNSHP